MRTLPPALLTLLDAGRVAYAGMIRIDLGEGSFGIIQSSADYTFQGVTYKAVPRGLVSVSASPMNIGSAAQGFQIEVVEAPDNGVTPTEIMNFEAYDYLDRAVTVMDLHVNPDTGAVLGDPVPLARGYVTAVRHEEDPSRGHIMVLECESRGLDYNRTNGRINSDQDQKRVSATDAFFSNASTTGTVEVKWGKA